MGKILCYIYEGMADFEISLLLHRLRNTGNKEIISISESLEPITAQSGLRYIPDKKIKEISFLDVNNDRDNLNVIDNFNAIDNHNDIDKLNDSDNLVFTNDIEALIIPGGPINNEQNSICSLANHMICSGKLVAAICFGPQFLGRAGILDDYQFTTSCSAEKIKQLGCAEPFNRDNYVLQRTVVDRNLITAQGYAFVDFAMEVCKYLQIFDSEQQEYEQLGRVKEN